MTIAELVDFLSLFKNESDVYFKYYDFMEQTEKVCDIQSASIDFETGFVFLKSYKEDTENV